MLCDSCAHKEVCRYLSMYDKVQKALKSTFAARIKSNSLGSMDYFEIPDLRCFLYFPLGTKTKKTPLEDLGHQDEPGECGSNAREKT